MTEDTATPTPSISTPPSEEKPFLVSSIGVMLLLGALVAFAMSVFCASTVFLLLWPGTYFSFALSIIAGIKGLKLLGKHADHDSSPKTIAFLQIANFVMVLDVVNLALGIAVLILLHSSELKGYFRTTNLPASTRAESTPATKPTKP